MISAKSISKTFDNKKVLDNVSVEIGEGEVISIVGPSGAGKTTLLHILSTLDSGDDNESFELILNKIKVQDLNEKEISNFRNTQIGFIFQFHELLPEFTALENICIPGMIKGVEINELKSKATDLLNSLDLIHVKDQNPSELSGGEQQRVAVARALINNPSMLFADEPSGNLDSKTADNLHQLFFDLRDQLNLTIVIVTHNKKLADMADRKLSLVDGKWVN
tara:strand:- start:766 stop:1428 length:663 start_codon:yes stop_codon:yes gene_type:complete